MSVSVIASYLGLSIPLAVVSAGLFMGNRTINIDEKNDHTKRWKNSGS